MYSTNKNKLPIIFFVLIFNVTQSICNNSSLNIIGFVNAYQGIGQVSLGFINCLHQETNINLFSTQKNELDGIPNHAKQIIFKSIKNLNSTNKFRKNITIYTDLLLDECFKNYINFANKITDRNTIKFIYSMVEATRVPDDWVKKINTYFDAVIVPDPFLISVYKNSGVKIPIFLLPISLQLNDFLKMQPKSKKADLFVFGFCAGFGESKNYNLLIDAFTQEFKNSKNVILKLHGNDGYYCQVIKNKIKKLNSKNILLTTNKLSRREYVDFISFLDCYITLSKGEGFSITPREAMAAGVPCIISNNTAHKTICKTNFVYSVPSNIIEPHITGFQKTIGFDFNCKIEDVRKAMKDVYNNYQKYLNLNEHAKQWVKIYLPENLRKYYINLIKPKKIILGSQNLITKESLMTNSQALYKKLKVKLNNEK